MKHSTTPQPKTPAQAIFRGQSAKKNRRRIPLLDQWVEIRVMDGKVTTELFPPNDVLMKEGQSMDPPPEMVYRRLHFPDGVPYVYSWVTKNEMMRRYGGLGIQRMSVDTWLEAIKREEERPDGHIGKTGIANLPRPEEHGECDCPVCARNRARLEKKSPEL